MPKIEVNHTVEDYLRALYRIQTREGKASNVALARELAISPSAVTEMARKLGQAGLVSYQRYKGLALMPEGLRLAIGVTRRHRLWEVFLIEHLHFSWDEVHELADELEHIGSALLIDRLEQFLEFPTHDPHGDPIPTREGRIVEQKLVALIDLEPGEDGVVHRVSDEGPELLRYASSLGLSISASVHVIERIPFDSSVRLTADGKEGVISEKLASSVFVARAEPRRVRKGRG